jgi:tetratricopeptide (TPR) repeat protein
LTKTPYQNVGYGDSDEFLSVGSNWGIAHPPGYILYTTVLTLAMKLPIPFTNATFRAHAISGLAFSITLYFGYISIQNLLSRINKKDKSNNVSIITTIASYGALFFIASNTFLFTYAVIAEKYMFASMFALALYALLTSTKTLNTKGGLVSYLITGGLLTGILLAYHQSFVFLLPYVIYVLVTKCKTKKVFSFSIFIASALAVVIASLGLTYIRLINHPKISWYADTTFQGVINIFTRKDFQGLIVDRGVQSNGYIPQSLTLNQIIISTKQLFLSLVQTSGFFAIILIILAIYVVYKNRKKIDPVHVFAPFILMGVMLISYLGWPTDLGSQATTERFFTFGFIFLIPVFAVGIYGLLDIGSTFLGELFDTSKPKQFFLYSILCLSIASLLLTAYKSNTKDFKIVSSTYHSMMSEFDTNALVTCYSDTSCFALLYEQSVLGMRKDVTIVPIAYPLIQNSINLTSLHLFTYTTNPYMLFDIVTNSIDQKSVYAVDISPYYYNMFGIDYAFMYYVPRGYYGQLVRQLPQNTPNINEELYKSIQKASIINNDLMQRRFVKSLAQSSFTNAHIFLFMNDRNKARIELNNAVNLSYKLTDTEKKAALSSRTTTEQTEWNNQYKPGSHVQTAQSLLDRLPELYKQNKNSQALRLVMGAITIDPTNINARLELARIYKKMGDTFYYKTEYLHALMIDPENEEAKQELSQYLQ